MIIEITEQAFNTLVTNETPLKEYEQHEHYNAFCYFEKGMRLKKVDYFVTQVTHYYMYDIND